MIAISCSGCQKKLSVKEESAGKKVKCPGCGQVHSVPALAAIGTPPPPPMSGSGPESLDLRTQPSLPDVGNRPTHPPVSNPDPTVGVEPVPHADVDTSLTDFLASPQAPDELGRLGKYRILKILGHGGMGVVYKAEDPTLKRTVAIKAMLPRLAASASSGTRFKREAEAMAAVEHDHIVRIYDILEDRGVTFMAMEFLKGEPLDERLRRAEPMPLAEILRIGREIAEGLAAAHATGLIHRDIKPANIWLEDRRERRVESQETKDKSPAPVCGHSTLSSCRVKILDFGLARAATQDAGLTQQGSILGTPAYMAPEQARGDTVDSRCDLFSLGVVLYRLCTGNQPFYGKDTVSTLMSVALHEPIHPIQVNAEMPPELSDLVMKLLEKDTAQRIGSAGEVIAALQKIEDELRRQKEIEGKTQAVSFVAPTSMAAASKNQASSDTVSAIAAPRRKKPLLMLALLFLGSLFVLAGGIAGIIRITTPEGDYVIDTDDPDFAFSVGKGAVVLEDKKTKRTYNLKVLKQKSGEFELEVTDPGNELAFLTKTFSIKRGEKVALKAWFERKGAEVANGGPVDDAWIKMVAALPAEKQVKAVADKLKELNPNFDGTVTHKVEAGVVTNLEVLTVNVTDISPVRALTVLQTLSCGAKFGTPRNGPLTNLSPLKHLKLTWFSCRDTQVSDLSPLKDMKLTVLDCAGSKVSDLSPLKDIPLTSLDFCYTSVSDLTPLKGMKLTFLDCRRTMVSDLSPLKNMPLKELRCNFKAERDAEILRSIKTLETINDKPAAEFWKEVDAQRAGFDAWLKQVAAMTPKKQVEAVKAELMTRNPGFDGKTVSHKVEDGVVTELSFSTQKVTDISPLRALTGLRILDCSGGDYYKRTGVLADLSPLKDLKLTSFACYSTNVSDLSPLKGMPLITLQTYRTLVVDLSPLKGMPLESLHCDFKAERDSEILRSIKTLKSINEKSALEFWKGVDAQQAAFDAWVKLVAALPADEQVKAVAARLKERNPGFDGKIDDHNIQESVVTYLRFVTDNVTDISPVRALSGLRTLQCKGSGGGKGQLADLSPLKDMKLTALDCGQTQVTDLSPLKHMKLTSLGCYDTSITDLSPLQGMPLTVLSTGGTKVSDLSPLKDMPLISLFCERTLVTDLSPLKDMKLTDLSCFGTKVADLSPLKGLPLTKLTCNATQIIDLSPLKGMPLRDIWCDFNPGRDAGILRSIKSLTTINGKPAQEVLKEVPAK